MKEKMMSNSCPFLDQMPNNLNMSQLEKLGEPVHKVITDLLLSWPDSKTRTPMVTALILTLWQQRADDLKQHVPSLILLNAGKAAPDPVDDFIATFTSEGMKNRPKSTMDRHKIVIEPQKAPDIMLNAVSNRRKLGPAYTHDSLDRKSATAWEKRYYDAKQIIYDKGTAQPYSRSWSEKFGYVTDEDDVLIARLNELPDQVAFRNDVINKPNKLCIPRGIGRGLLFVDKKATVSGSVTENLWDEELVLGIIKLGLPVLFIPHISSEMITVPNPFALNVLPTLWRNYSVPTRRESLDLPPFWWFEIYTKEIRQRLRMLPGTGTYEFAVLQAIRQLGSLCKQFANFTEAKTEEQTDLLYWELYSRAYRGITHGVLALAWHCLGFDPGCPREKAVKILRDLRTKGPMSRNKIRRDYHLKNKEQRDIILARLAAEDLVRIDGQSITATNFEEFVSALLTRTKFPEVPNFLGATNDESSG